MEKILVSACFLGDRVRYDGKTKQLDNDIINRWIAQERIVKFCPEVAGGLPIPRPAAEIAQSTNQVITQQGVDVTSAFERGAQKALSICKTNQIKYAILKQSSPSCGSKTIYDGTFSGQKITGEGVTTRLLRANGIQVFSEDNLEELALILSAN